MRTRPAGAYGARCSAVPAWKGIEQAEPDFAARVRRLFDGGRHKTIATLRAEGSPRMSAIECEFSDGCGDRDVVELTVRVVESDDSTAQDTLEVRCP